MPEERIVNRVSQTYGYQLETEKLKAQDGAVAPADVSDVVVFRKTDVAEQSATDLDWSMSPAAAAGHVASLPETAEGQRAGQIGLVEPVSTPTQETFPPSGALSRVDVEQILGSVLLARDPDLAGFKKQVVAAFKHLGLDTKQFFGV